LFSDGNLKKRTDTIGAAPAETCLRYLWPLLVADGRFFTHEAQELHLASFFFDHAWWTSTLDRPAPGLAGAGSGLGLLPGAGGYGSELGYTIKAR
jgi:hypothetical protein